MAVGADSVNEVRGCAVGRPARIDPFYCKIKDIFIEQEFMFHTSGFLESFQVFGKLGQTLVKEARKSPFDLTLFVGL